MKKKVVGIPVTGLMDMCFALFSINCKNIQCLLTSLVTHKTYDYLKKYFSR